MKLSQIAVWIRHIVGVLLLVVAAYAGWLSTLLFDRSNFQTEGSPAGAAMFVVLLMAPVVALGALLIGIFLLYPRKPKSTEQTVWTHRPPSQKPAARRGERWYQHANGAQLGALFNNGRAVLIWIDANARSARRSQGGALNPRSLSHPFVCRDGSLVQLPFLWTVPDTLAESEIALFETDGECSKAPGWQAIRVPESADSQAWQTA